MVHNLLLHQVPMLFHHANILPAKTEKKVVSTLDALPTALSYLGYPFQIRTLGRDLYRNRTPSQNNFIFSWNGGDPRYGVINDRFYFTTHSGVDALYEYLSDGATINAREKYPDEFERLKKLNQAFFEISTYLLYHNLKM
jgi:arylsulfatase A-like enzyme